MTRSTLDTGITRTLPDDTKRETFDSKKPERPPHPSALDREGTPRHDPDTCLGGMNCPECA